MTREIPYQPDPKPPGPSFEHMQAVLDKHAKRLGAGQSPKAKSDEEKTTGPHQPSALGLAWSEPKKGLGFVYIEAGPYRITRENKQYKCHREAYYLGTRDNAEAAKILCTEDLNACRPT